MPDLPASKEVAITTYQRVLGWRDGLARAHVALYAARLGFTIHIERGDKTIASSPGAKARGIAEMHLRGPRR